MDSFNTTHPSPTRFCIGEKDNEGSYTRRVARRRKYWSDKYTFWFLGMQDGKEAFSVISNLEDGIWPAEDLAEGRIIELSKVPGGHVDRLVKVHNFTPGRYRTVPDFKSRRINRNCRASHTGIVICHSISNDSI